MSTEKLVDVTKGTRVHVDMYRTNKAALSGSQMKFGATRHQFEGTIRHIRGDHPTEPKRIAFWVEPDSDAEKHGAQMCEKCGVLEVGPLLKENLSAYFEEDKAETEEKPRGHYTGRCSNCGSTDLWDDETAYGCHSCGSVYHTG